MGYDLQRQELLDPHGGQAHLHDRVLHHVSKAFAEDPLRVLRAVMQFGARFQLNVAPETLSFVALSHPNCNTSPKNASIGKWKSCS